MGNTSSNNTEVKCESGIAEKESLCQGERRILIPLHEKNDRSRVLLQRFSS